jgi:hypothetical protein
MTLRDTVPNWRLRVLLYSEIEERRAGDDDSRSDIGAAILVGVMVATTALGLLVNVFVLGEACVAQ